VRRESLPGIVAYRLPESRQKSYHLPYCDGMMMDLDQTDRDAEAIAARERCIMYTAVKGYSGFDGPGSFVGKLSRVRAVQGCDDRHCGGDIIGEQ
jgi:hypothetical protein